MIIRILGEGQYDVAAADIDALNRLDTRLLDAVESNDTTAFTPLLEELLGAVRRLGTPLADDALVASELVLPAADSDLPQVEALLSDDGLIPG